MAGRKSTTDLGILFADDVEGWKTYFEGKLGKTDSVADSDLRLSTTTVNTNLLLSPLARNQITNSRCLLFLVSPQFIDGLKENISAVDWLFMKPSATVFLFLSTEEHEVGELMNNVEKYSQFVKYTAPTDNTKVTNDWVNEVANKVIEIFEASSRVVDKKKTAPRPAARPKPSPRPDPNRPVDDNQVNSFQTAGGAEENSADMAEDEVGFRCVEPTTVSPMNDKIVILMNSSKVGKSEKFASNAIRITLWSETKTFTLQFTKYSSFTFVATVPKDCPPGSYRLTFYHENVKRASTSIQVLTSADVFRETLCKAATPLQLMADVLGVDSTDTSAVDKALCDMLLPSLPEESHKLNGLFTQYMNEADPAMQSSNKELPTMLHFAAKFGLEHFCVQLMKCPGASWAFSIDNKYGDYPSSIAEKAGYKELAQYLEEELEMLTVRSTMEEVYANMDTYVPAPCSPGEGGGYVLSDQHYTNRNVGFQPYSNVSGGESSYDIAVSHAITEEGDYMTMQGRVLGEDVQGLYLDVENIEPRPLAKPESRSHSFTHGQRAAPSSVKPKLASTLPPGAVPSYNVGGIMGEPPKPPPGGSRTEQSLLDINKGVASGEYTQDEALSLFRALNMRTNLEGDSMKERKKQIDDIRSQYSQMINYVKKDSKKEGIFSRFFKMKKRKPSLVPEPKIEHLCGKSADPPVALAEEEVPTYRELEQSPSKKCLLNRGSSASLSSNGSRSSTLSSCSGGGRDSGSFSSNDPPTDDYGGTYSCVDPLMPPIHEVDRSPPQVYRRVSGHKSQSVKGERRSLRSEMLLKDSNSGPPPALPPRSAGRPLPATPDESSPGAVPRPRKKSSTPSLQDFASNQRFQKQKDSVDGNSSEGSIPDSPPPPPPRSANRP